MKDTLKTHIKHLEIKTTISEMENTMDEINSRLDNAKEKISGLDDTAITLQDKI